MASIETLPAIVPGPSMRGLSNTIRARESVHDRRFHISGSMENIIMAKAQNAKNR